MKILLIDDDATIREVLKKELESNKFIVETAEDGAEGLNKALKDHPDLIILDIELPNMRGGMVLGKLREDSWGKDVPVLVLSSNETAASVADIVSKGAFEYLHKSDWELSEVVDKVKEILAKK
jgi:DNA-binding response OmpR family regulator